MVPHVSADSPTLLLLPTELERRRFLDQGGIEPDLARAELCGFGPVAAAARTASLLAELGPRRVVLLGIAGAYDVERHPIGSALVFSQVAIDGVGAGSGDSFRGPPALGFPQWPRSHDGAAIEDVLPLIAPPDASAGLLLTTCAASDSPEHAQERLARFPEAVAEDMEGFAVALACALADVPATIVRGISNRVGDRDPAGWRVPTALATARRLTLELLERDSWEAPA